ncbi:MAG: glycosyltransferase family 2 protein [Chloroflexota bacterium]|nr:glycosyltransferase family 2 protein [Chloroflexota bacterium]
MEPFPGSPKVTVLICTLNEVENLPHVLPHIPGWVDEVLIVDGRSTDGTVELAMQLCPRARVVLQPGKGKGEALKYGVQQASGDIVVTLDADGETDPKDMERFIEPLLRGYDYAKGSRFTRGWADKPFHRIFGNWLIAKTCNVLYGVKFTDLCSGYNAFWKRVTVDVNLWSKDGWNFEPLFIARLLKAKRKVIEVPQRASSRISGHSKLPNWHQGFSAIRVLITERFSRTGR